MRHTDQASGASTERGAFSLFWSLRFRTLLLVLLAVVPALLLLGYTARQQRRMATERTRDTTLRLARLVASDVQGRVEGAREMLTTLAELPAIQERDKAGSERALRNLLLQHPSYANIGAIAPNGQVVASARPMPPQVNLGDRSYFQRALRSRGFAVGDYQVGRITRTSTVNFAYPVLDAAGRVRVVVFAALRLDWVASFSQWNLPDRTMFLLVNDAGSVLLGYPNPNAWVGRKMDDTDFMRRIFADKEGHAEGTALDGTSRVIAFTPLHLMKESRPVAVVIGVPMDSVYREIDRYYLQSMLGMGLVAALALMAAWIGGNLFFLRQVKALVRTARRIRGGDLGARTGLHHGRDELSRLTQAFDAMAESLEDLTGRHELILASAGEGIYGVDREGRSTFANPAAARMLGYRPEEMLGRHPHDLFHHARPDGTPYPEADCPVEHTLRYGTVNRRDDEVFWRKDGTAFPVEYVVTPAREHGNIVGAVIAFQDITQRKETERELMRAHEEVLGTELEKKRFYREVIRTVSKNRLHLVDPGDIPAEGRPVAEGRLESPADDREARRRVREAATEAGMEMNRVRELTLAVGEATTNAVKHATLGRYEVYLTDDRVIVRVTDRGEGISEQDLPASLLEAGYSTKVSLGMGYTLMLELSDRVWLATGPEGTTLQLEKHITPIETPNTSMLTAIDRVAGDGETAAE